MYYEEKMLGGRLYYRTTPKGEWYEAGVEKCLNKIDSLTEEITRLRAALRHCHEITSEYC